MKNFLVASFSVLALWAAPRLAPAQGRGPDTAPSAAQQLVEEIGLDRLPTGVAPARPADARNLSVLRQVGAGNAATIDQLSTGNGPNQALIEQVGAANAVNLSQFGANNTANLALTGNRNAAAVDQRGTNNSFDGRVAGDRNALDVVQDGQNNRSVLDVTGNDCRYPITQIGNDNTLIQREAAGTLAPQGYGVQMRGNGIRLTIEQGRATP